MSLFTAALGGAGKAAGDMADVWIREESTMNLQNNQGRIEEGKARLVAQLQNDNAFQEHLRRLEADKAHFANKVQATKDVTAHDLSDPVTALRAKQAGAIKLEESKNTASTLNPGDTRIIGTGTNTTQTPAQIQADLYREGIRRDGASRAAPKAVDWDKLFKDDYFKTTDKAGNEVVDFDAKDVAVRMAKKDVANGMDPDQARTVAMRGINKIRTESGGDPAKAAAMYRKALQGAGLAPADAPAPAPAESNKPDHKAELAERDARGRAENARISSYTSTTDADALRNRRDEEAMQERRPSLFSQAKDADRGRTGGSNNLGPSMEEINRMGSREAYAALDKFRDVLSPEQLRALKKRT